MPPQRRHTPNPADQTGTAGEPNEVPNHQAEPKASRQPEGQDIVPGTVDTTTTDTAHRVGRATDPEFEIHRLTTFLDQRFPNVAIMTPTGPEGPVDTAIRLLEGMATAGDTVRCGESFCNKPKGHRDEHGWIVRQ